MLTKIVINTASQVIAKGFTATSSLIVTILIGRALGEVGFGQFTKIFVFVGYFYTFVDFGLNTIYVRETTKESQIRQVRVLLGIRLILSFAFAALAILIALALPYNQQAQTGFPPFVKVGIILVSLTILTQALFISANAYFQRNLKYYFSTVASISSAAVVLAASAFFYFKNGGVLAYSFAYVIGGIFLAGTSLFLLAKVAREKIFPVFSKKESIYFLSHAWPIGAALILNIVYFKVDVFVLSNFRSTAEVGLYGLAYQFFEASLALPIFLTNSIYPPLSDSFKEDLALFAKNLKFWFIVLFFVAVLISAFLFFGAYLLPFIYQGKFAGSVPALQILSLGMPFFFLSALLWHVFIIFKKQKFLMVIYFLGALVNIIANLLFIPTYGYLAAAAVTVASEAIIFLLMVLFLTLVKKPQSFHIS